METRDVHLWQGEADTLVPPAMGRYQAEQLPNCHFQLLPGEGHLLIIDRMPDLVEEFRQATRSREDGSAADSGTGP